MRDDVAARDPGEDVEDDRAHLRVGADDLERIDHALRVAAASEVAEVRRAAADERDHVERGHHEPGAVAEDPDLAVELDVGDALLARGALLRRVRLEVAHLCDVGVLVERVVVDGELRVERAYLAFGGDDQRVDLAEHRVGLDEAGVELPDDVEDLLLLVRVADPGAIDQATGLVGLKALERVDVQADERIRILLGDLLDLDAALGGEHEERLLEATVEGDGEVVLGRDLGRALDPELAHDVSVDVEPEDRFGLALSVFRAVRELDAAGLPSAACQHLRLDDDLAAELLGGGARLGRRGGEPTLGDRDAEAAEELLALVLVEIHGGGC